MAFKGFGRLVRAYAMGRRDARAGRRRPPEKLPSRALREIYLQGLEDERHKMLVDKRLVQTEMPFMHE